MKPQHIRAKPEDIARRVIVAGDPARVKQLSELLENARVVNRNRGFLTYTGVYKGEEITIATHGVGAPSLAIVVEDLIMLGARVVVRLGTCGGMVKELRRGDLVIVTGAAYYCGGGALGMYAPGACMPTAPHPEVTIALINEAKRKGIRYMVGPVFSSDAFYAEDKEFVNKWVSRGIIAVEMECATLFALGWMRNVKTGALLIVSNSLVVKDEQEMFTAEKLRKYVDVAGRIVLDSLVKIDA